ncbi:MAG: thiamine pyrophosphate-dependent acetolactate synthase large subunit-like protein [Gammaproteobacteria bacterium]|jgi:thiamine pyrophosphate-dependent acetolactate synthase large subunit-like protein
MGDGGFGFTMAEISTTVEYQLPVVAIVLDNGPGELRKPIKRNF